MLKNRFSDERYKSGKPFIITINLSLKDLQKPADLGYGRIYGHIMERCVPVSLELGTDYEIAAYSDNLKKGTATVTFKGIGAYAGEKTVKFKINSAKIE